MADTEPVMCWYRERSTFDLLMDGKVVLSHPAAPGPSGSQGCHNLVVSRESQGSEARPGGKGLRLLSGYTGLGGG